MRKFFLTIVVLAVTGVAWAAPSALELTAQTGEAKKAFQLKGKHARQQLVATAAEGGVPVVTESLGSNDDLAATIAAHDEEVRQLEVHQQEVRQLEVSFETQDQDLIKNQDDLKNKLINGLVLKEHL